MLRATQLAGFMSAHPAATGGFDPADLIGGSDIGDIWDASELSTMFTDAGTTSVTTPGDLIYQWDGMVNGYSFIQATSTARPTYETAGALFDESASVRYMGCTLPSTITGTELCGVAVVRFPSAPSDELSLLGAFETLGYSVGSTTAASLIYSDAAGNDMSGYRNWEVKSTTTGSAIATGTDYLIDSEYDGTDHTLRLDGSAQTAVASTDTFSSGFLTLGGEVNFSNGRHCQFKWFMVIDRVLTAGERSDLTDYLTTRFSL